MDVEKLLRLRTTIAALLDNPGEPMAAESLATQYGALRRQVYLALADSPLQQEFEAIVPQEPKRPSGLTSLATFPMWHGAGIQGLSSMLGWIDGQIGVERLRSEVQAQAKRRPPGFAH